MICSDAMRCDGNLTNLVWVSFGIVFHRANFNYEEGRIKRFDFCFSEGEEDEEQRPELASASTEEFVAPCKSIVLHDLAQI